MARNGSGTYSVPNTFVNGTTADADEVNANYTDMGNEITNSIAADGQTTPTANLPMGGFRHTNVSNAAASNQYAALGQVQAQAFTWCGTAGGTVDAITLSPSPAITAYAAGQEFRFVAASNNTGETTIAVSGLATKAAQLNGSALAADDIVSGKIYKAIYDGTQFQISRFSDPVTNILTTANTFTKTQTWTKGSDVASASTLTLGDGNYFDVTGTTAITAIATKGVGTTVKLHFDGALTLTHNATDLILPGGSNITTAAGDEFEFTEYASGDWRCTAYALANGEAVIGSTPTEATQAQQEAGTASDVFVTPAVQQYHKSASKAWANLNGTGTIAIRDSLNVSSVIDNGVGSYTYNFTNSFADTNFYPDASFGTDPATIGSNTTGATHIPSRAVGSVGVLVKYHAGSSASLFDDAQTGFSALGGLA